jgi:hypothetical protein
MLRNSNNPGRLSVNAGSTAARWRSVFIALLLALTIGSAGQISPAQAAPAGDTLKFSMRADRSRSTNSLCVGDEVNIYVSVKRTGSYFGTPYSEGVSGASVEAFVGDPSNIGTISPQGNTTGWDLDNAGMAKFVFTAKEIGETAVGFTGKIDHHWFGTRLVDIRDIVEDGFAVKVIPCKFKVTTISRVSAVSSNAEGTSNEAEVVADAQGNFKGSTTVNWQVVNTTSCVFSLLSLTPSQVDWSGTIDSDQLVLTGTFQPTTTSYSFTCPGIPGGDSGQHINPIEPLTIRVALTGGGSTQPQMVSNAAGSAVIVVIPEE